MEWSAETILRLRALWDEGLSTAEIGRRLGFSKNAVVGKAHRLDLPSRPSPIRRDGSASRTPKPRQPAPAPRQTLPLLSSLEGWQEPQKVYPKKARVQRPPKPRLATQDGVVVDASITPPSIYNKPFYSGTCCWPLGEPGTPSFRFCDEAIKRGAYCADHAHQAYIPPSRRKAEKLAA